MSIFYICGKPGGGKSYLGVKQICEELADPKSNRYIVTNIVLNFGDREEQIELPPPWSWRVFGWLLCWFTSPPEPKFKTKVHKGLATWCHENLKHEVNLRERIRILDDQEAGEFWLYEPGRKFGQRKTIKVGKHEKEVPDFEDRAARGCLYVVDECHNYFPAREWQLTGSDATFFLSQHRKLQCDVIFITQHPEQCDKALRRLAQEYMTVRNLSREPILGFSWGNLFRYVRSLNSPQSPNPAVFESGFVRLKPEEIGDLYDTMAGVGIAGRVTPKTEARGRSPWWLAIPAALLIAGTWYVFTHIQEINAALAHGMARAFFHSAKAVSQSPGSILGVPVPIHDTNSVQTASQLIRHEIPDSLAGLDDTPTIPQILGDTPDDTNPVVCIGWTILGTNDVTIFFSDGSTAYSQDGEIQKITHHWVTAFGRRYRVICGRAESPAPSVDSFSQSQAVSVSPSISQSQGTVEVLPAVHSQTYGIQTPRINGLASMGQNRFQSQQPQPDLDYQQ